MNIPSRFSPNGAIKISSGRYVSFGHRVTNLTSIQAVVVGVDEDEGDLFLREVDPTTGKMMHGGWIGNPEKTR